MLRERANIIQAWGETTGGMHGCKYFLPIH
jgi:hypothetical protein